MQAQRSRRRAISPVTPTNPRRSTHILPNQIQVKEGTKYFCDFDTLNYRRKINAIQDSQVASSLALSVNLKNLNTSEQQLHKQIFTNNGSEINYEKDIMKKGTYDPPPSPVSSYNEQMFPPALGTSLSRVPSCTGDSPMQHDKIG